MKYAIVIFTILLAVTGCTTFSTNEHALKDACKNGVSEYDDGSMSFKCYDKAPKVRDEKSAEPTK
jgi:hypothetical protein